MEKYMVQLDWETVDDIVAKQLKDTRDGLIQDLERVKAKGKGDVFDLDIDIDVPLIQKHIEACEMLYKYYGGK